MASAMRIHLIQPSISARDWHPLARSCEHANARSPKCVTITLADFQISISLTMLGQRWALSNSLLLCRRSDRSDSCFIPQHETQMLFGE
jgi:hypothetical protein